MNKYNTSWVRSLFIVLLVMVACVAILLERRCNRVYKSEREFFCWHDAEVTNRLSELDSGARGYVGPSAAFVFNTFGNIGSKFKYNNNEYCIMAYEKELPAIKSTLEKGKSHKHNAHLDAYIINDKEEIFVETKLIEWLHPPKNLSPAYLDKNNYLYIDGADFFIEIFKSLISNQLVRDSKGEDRYKSKYEKYDAIQMTIHTLAIYNYCLSKSNKNNIIKLWNVVFDYKESDKYITEEQEANDFIKKFSGKFNELFLNIGINFELQYIPFSEFYKKIEFDDIRHKEYLKRYIID